MKRQKSSQRGELPIVLRIGHMKTAARARWRAGGLGGRWVSTHGMIMAGSMPLLSLAIYLGWQMAVPASEISAPARIAKPPTMNLDATGPARPAEGFALTTTARKPIAEPTSSRRPAAIVNVEGVTPIYSEPPLYHSNARADGVVPALLHEDAPSELVEEAMDESGPESEWEDPR